MILAIDPGTEQSAIVGWDGKEISKSLIIGNDDIFPVLDAAKLEYEHLVIEEIRSYGNIIGQTTIDTIFWSGRFAQHWKSLDKPFTMVPRLDVKMHICHAANAKDANINQALKDRFGEKGTKKNPGVLYSLASHKWQAFALAVYYVDTH